jgi:hypothetical protein
MHATDSSGGKDAYSSPMCNPHRRRYSCRPIKAPGHRDRKITHAQFSYIGFGPNNLQLLVREANV